MLWGSSNNMPFCTVAGRQLIFTDSRVMYHKKVVSSDLRAIILMPAEGKTTTDLGSFRFLQLAPLRLSFECSQTRA